MKRGIIACYRLDGTLKRTYKSAKAASKAIGAFHSAVSVCIRENKGSLHGYMFRRYSSLEEVEKKISPYKEDVPSNIGNKKSKEYVKGSKGVIKYTLEGKYIKTYSSISLAAKENNIKSIDIINCLKGKYKQSHGYKWKAVNKGDFKIVKKSRKPKPKIIQCDLNGKVIRTFTSVIDASRYTGTDRNSIYKCFSNKQKTANGYRWKRK